MAVPLVHYALGAANVEMQDIIWGKFHKSGFYTIDTRRGLPSPYKMTIAVSQTGPISSVPALQEASQLALTVVNASQKIRRNKAAFNRLANNTFEFVDDMIKCYRIIERYFPLGVPEDLAVVFQRTVNSLKCSRNFTRSVASRNFLTALLFSRLDMREIETHDLTLLMNKGSFKIIYNAYLTSLVIKLSAEALEALAQRFEAATGVEETN